MDVAPHVMLDQRASGLIFIRSNLASRSTTSAFARVTDCSRRMAVTRAWRRQAFLKPFHFRHFNSAIHERTSLRWKGLGEVRGAVDFYTMPRVKKVMRERRVGRAIDYTCWVRRSFSSGAFIDCLPPSESSIERLVRCLRFIGRQGAR